MSIFTDVCFERDLRYQLQGRKRNFKLIATAVPTIFDFEDKLQHGKVSGETRKRVSSQKREDKRRKSESIEEACCSYSTMKPESRKQGRRSKSSESSCDTTLDLLDVSPMLVSTGTQTIESSFHQPKSGYFIHPNSCSEDESDDDDERTCDEIYEPCDSEITDEDETAIENKYVLVEWNQLKMLFIRCLSCGRKVVLKDVSRKDSMFKVCVQCNVHKC